MPDRTEPNAELVAMLRDAAEGRWQRNWTREEAKALLAALQSPTPPASPDAATARELADRLDVCNRLNTGEAAVAGMRHAIDAAAMLRTLAAECEAARYLLDLIADAPLKLQILQQQVAPLKADRDRLAAELSQAVKDKLHVWDVLTTSVKDQCDTETVIEAACKRVGIVRQGDSYGMETVEEMVDRLAAEVERVRQEATAIENVAHFAWTDPATVRSAFADIENRAKSIAALAPSSAAAPEGGK